MTRKLRPPSDAVPFWERKSLDEMDDDEWESLCDRCGRCCVMKVQDIDTGAIYPTSVACRLLDRDTGRCTNYAERHRLVPECLSIDAEAVRTYDFLPQSCAYRRVAEGRGLAWWHPLVSGDPGTVAKAGASIAGSVVSEEAVHPDEDMEAYILRWVEPDE